MRYARYHTELVSILCIFLASFEIAYAMEKNQTVMAQVQTAFYERNQNIGEITFIQIIPWYGHEKRYLLLAHGIRADKRFLGSFEDELFGLFVVDKPFSKVLRTIDFIRTQSWNDYSVQISISGDTILATCKGATYGDGKTEKKYSTSLIWDIR